jgi:hypothetical protein
MGLGTAASMERLLCRYLVQPVQPPMVPDGSPLSAWAQQAETIARAISSLRTG